MLSGEVGQYRADHGLVLHAHILVLQEFEVGVVLAEVAARPALLDTPPPGFRVWGLGFRGNGLP